MTAQKRGWGAAPTARGEIVTVKCRSSGVRLPVHSAIAELVCTLADATEERGYALVDGWCWGYAPRKIRGSQSWSNHAWGLAVDLNSIRNPMGSRLVTDMPDWMVALWESCGFRWGGRFKRRPDAMHYEYMGGPGDVAGHLRIAMSGSGGTHAGTQPAPQQPEPPQPDPLEADMTLVRSIDNGGVWLLAGGVRMRVATRAELDAWAAAGARHVISEGEIDGFAIPEQALQQWPWPEPSARPFASEPVDA